VFVGTGVFVGGKVVAVGGMSVIAGISGAQVSRRVAEIAIPVSLRKSRRDSCFMPSMRCSFFAFLRTF
jgi:hypothetical protein